MLLVMFVFVAPAKLQYFPRPTEAVGVWRGDLQYEYSDANPFNSLA